MRAILLRALVSHRSTDLQVAVTHHDIKSEKTDVNATKSEIQSRCFLGLNNTPTSQNINIKPLKGEVKGEVNINVLLGNPGSWMCHDMQTEYSPNSKNTQRHPTDTPSD